MRTKQNYCAPTAQANPIVPTAQPIPSTVDSGQPAAEDTPTSIYERMSLHYASDCCTDSSAMITFKALSAYQREQQRWLIKYMHEGDDFSLISAGAALSEIERVGDLLTEIAENLAFEADKKRRELLKYTHPARYQTEEEYNADAEDEYDTAIRSILLN